MTSSLSRTEIPTSLKPTYNIGITAMSLVKQQTSKVLLLRQNYTHCRLNSPLAPFNRSPPCRNLRTSTCLRDSFFNLGGLSISRESQFLSKERGLPRVDFSPHLELIRSSEVDTQRIPSFNEVPNPARKPFQSQQEQVGSRGLVSITEASLKDVTNKIKILEMRLKSAEMTSKQLFDSYTRRTKESNVLACVCFILTLGFIYVEEVRKLYTSILQVWTGNGPATSPADGKATKSSALQTPPKILQDTVTNSSEHGAESDQIGILTWLGKTSGLFWAASN